MRPPLAVTTSASYDELLATLVADKVASKLAAKDPTLWGPDAESEASIRLGWVDLPTTSRPLLAEIDALRAAAVVRGHRPGRALRHGRLVAGARGDLAHATACR